MITHSSQMQRTLDAYNIDYSISSERVFDGINETKSLSRTNSLQNFIKRIESVKNTSATPYFLFHLKENRIHPESGIYVCDPVNGGGYGNFKFYDGAGLIKYQSEKCYLKKFTHDSLKKISLKFREQRVTYFLRGLLDRNDKKLMERYESHKEEFAILDDFIIFPNLPHMSSYSHASSEPATQLKDRKHGVILGAWFVHPNQCICFIDEISPERASEIKDKLPVTNEYKNDNRTIKEIEANTGIKYLTSILDLDQSDVPALINLRNNVLSHIKKVYNVDKSVDNVRMAFHFPVSKENATLHLHISINRAHHPLDLARSFDLDQLITNLSQGKNVSELIIKRDESGYGEGVYLIPKTDNAINSKSEVVKNTLLWVLNEDSGHVLKE
ncbi:hypothetical protein [Serratia odorifera]|uniref:hypothetical protein n=1 Tax=Serratia odorifera TaxID=618 RepID=UPI0018E83E26|nr:hypothetical protein [Serratia odorifera]MBJ2066167.1 hypothetical protein [Serratia odorifera]